MKKQLTVLDDNNNIVAISQGSIDTVSNALKKFEDPRHLIEQYMIAESELVKTFIGFAIDGYPFN